MSKVNSSKPCKQNYEMCSLSKCKCKGKSCDYVHKQYGLKKWVFNLIIFVITIGLIVPFASETICTIWFPEVALGLNTWNQFVSIALGVVATILSIVSMIMSFKKYF